MELSAVYISGYMVHIHIFNVLLKKINMAAVIIGLFKDIYFIFYLNVFLIVHLDDN